MKQFMLTKLNVRIKKSRFKEKFRYKEQNSDDQAHSLNEDLTVICNFYLCRLSQSKADSLDMAPHGMSVSEL